MTYPPFTMLQLNPPIPLTTPKGNGWAHLVIDYGPEFDLIWVVFIDDSGECWSFRNSEVRIQPNITLGRKPMPRNSPAPSSPPQ